MSAPRYKAPQGRWPQDRPVDLTPAPGGVQGHPVDYVRWYPPDTPYLWGQGFPTPWGLNYFSQWTSQFLPSTRWQPSPDTPTSTFMFPNAFGANGSWQLQLNGNGVPRGTAAQATVDRLNNQQPTEGGPLVALAGAWGRVS